MTRTATLQVLIVDDHPIVRDGIRVRIESRPDWAVCGEAESSPEALTLSRELQPDVVTVDLSLEQGSGLELIKQLRALPEPPRVLVCSMHDEDLYAQRAIQAGATGYLHKSRAASQLLEAIDRVANGKMYISERVSEQVLSRMLRSPDRASKSPVEDLTDRELEVFEAIGQGVTIQKIAQMLHLSPKTVETYRDRIKRKVGVKTSAELLRYAVKWVGEFHG